MDGYDPNIIIEGTAFAALRKLQEDSVFSLLSKSQLTGTFAALREMQSTLSAIKAPIAELNASIKEYQKIATPIAESLKLINTVYAPVLRQALVSNTMSLKAIVSGVQASASVMSSLSGLNLSNVASILDQLPKYDFTSELETDDFTVDEAERLYEIGEITQEEINEEVVEIINKKQFSPKAEWDKIKKSKWFLAIKVLMVLLTFACRPVIEYTEDKVRDAVGITQMLDDIGIYEFIDSVFDISDNGTVSEEDAKATVDEAKTGNISKQKREDLLAKIKEIRTFISSAPQDDNTGNLLSYLSELEKDVCGKKYGLVFEEHREDIDEVLDTHTPVLTEDTELFIDNSGEINFLIEGDNLASLKLLEKTHKGKIDLIYIDPPYNTGNKDFIYDDAFVDKTDLFSHSKWLSFMECRLKIARKLLSEKGAIFISIDDHEESSLKLLCDAIFGEEFFIANISWQRTYSMRNDSKGIASEVEHILVYSKSTAWNPKKLERTAEMNAKYKNPDNDPNGAWRNIVASAPNASTHQGMVYAIQNPLTGEYCYPPQGRCWALGQDQMLNAMKQWCEYELVDLQDDETRARICGVTVEQIRRNVLSIVVKGSLEKAKENALQKYKGVIPEFFFSQKGKGALSRKAYINNMGGRPVTNFWSHTETGHTDEASRLLKSLFDGTAVFDTPKPPRLIERILHIATNDQSVILDFFAGSGTTGHAVLKYNANNEGSNRRFILCTNNENNICREVTYERIKRVVDKEGYEASLKYYKVEYIPISERMYYEYADDLLMHIRELVELENGVNFKGNAEIGIVLTEEELDEFIENVDAFAKCKKLYMGHDLLPNDEQEEILKARDIEISIIPDYYYRDLQEN